MVSQGQDPQAPKVYGHSFSLAQIYRNQSEAVSLLGFLGKSAETQTYSRAPLTVISLPKDLRTGSSRAILSCRP